MGLRGATDEEVLAQACEERRVVFTCNYSDPSHSFTAMHAEWLEAGPEHGGVLLCPQGLVSTRPDEVFRRLLEFLNRHTAEEVTSQLLWLP